MTFLERHSQSQIEAEGDVVVIHHVHIERRMNLGDSTPQPLELAFIAYGIALRDRVAAGVDVDLVDTASGQGHKQRIRASHVHDVSLSDRPGAPRMSSAAACGAGCGAGR